MKTKLALCTIALLCLVSFNAVVAEAQTKKVEAEIGWRTVDEKTIVLVKDGTIVMRMEVTPDVDIKVKDKEGNFKKGTLDDLSSGFSVEIEYMDENNRKVAKAINVTPKKAGDEE